MADADMRVVFGASVTGLIAGVKEAREAIEGLRAPIDDFVRDLRGISEAIGAAFVIDKIKEFVSAMAEVGEHAVNMGTALGMSAEQFQQLNEAMGLVGASGDALVRTERMLSRVAETAIAQPISHQADAFVALGLSAAKFAETLRTDPIAALKELADAAVRTGNLSLTGPLGFLLGKSGGADLVRFFSEGSAGIDKLIAKVNELGSPSQKALEDMDKLAGKIHEMTTAMENFGLAVGTAIGGPLGRYLDWLTESYSLGTLWLKGLPQLGPGAMGAGGEGLPERYAPARQELTSPEVSGMSDKTKVRLWLYANGYTDESIAAIMGNIGAESDFNPAARTGSHFGLLQWDKDRQAPLGGSTDIATQMELMDRELQKLDPAFRTATGDVSALAARFEKVFERSGGQAEAKREAGARAEFAGGGVTLPEVKVSGAVPQPMGDSIAAKKAADDKIKAIDDETKARLAQLDFERTAAQNDAAIIHTIEQQKIATVEEAEQRKRSVINATSGAVRDALNKEHNSMVEGIDLQKQALASDQKYHQQAVENANRLLEVNIKGLNATEQEDLKQVEQRYRYGQITIQQATDTEKQVVEAHRQAVDQILDQEQKLAAGIPEIEQKIATERVKINQETAQKLKSIDDKYLDDKFQAAKAINDKLASTLSGGIMGVISGRQSAGAAASGALQSLLGDALTKGLERAFEASPIGTAVNSLFEKAFSSLLSSAVPSAIGGAASGAASSAPVVSAITVETGTLTSTLTGMGLAITTAIEGQTAVLAPLLTAVAVKPSVLGTTYAGGGIVPSAQGGWVVPSTGGSFAQLHAREMVLPAHISDGLQQMIGGGGGGHTFNMNISAMDGASVMRHGPALVASINNALRNGSALRSS